jgi:hypothetical protein
MTNNYQKQKGGCRELRNLGTVTVLCSGIGTRQIFLHFEFQKLGNCQKLPSHSHEKSVGPVLPNPKIWLATPEGSEQNRAHV